MWSRLWRQRVRPELAGKFVRFGTPRRQSRRGAWSGSVERLETRALLSTLLGVIANNTLVQFDSATPGAITSAVPISGLQAGEAIAGIDFRPATGQLYGLGITGIGVAQVPDTGRLYTIDTTTAIATLVGSGPFSTTLAGSASYGFDFDPAGDVIRVVNDADQNLRLNPNNGTVAGVDTNLAFVAGDPNASVNANVVGAAYDRNVAGAPATTLFGIDFGRNLLVRQGGVDGSPSPNGGGLTTIGPLGLTLNGGSQAFDIGGNAGTAYAALAVLAVSGVNQTGLYTIDLGTGAATLIGVIGTGNIALPGLAIAPVGTFQFSASTYSVGESGPVATITVNRVAGSDGVATVRLDTTDGTATAPADYTDSDQTVTFPAGVTIQTIQIPINNDALDEADETINLALSRPSGGAALGSPATAVLTIIDDDPTPTLSITDVTVTEGDTGTVSAVFNVTLSAASGQPVLVDAATADGTAVAPGDYTALPSTTLTFAPGVTTNTVTVSVNGDTLTEPNETFFVNLSNAKNAAISDAQGVGTITNDDVTPTISISDVTVAEGSGGTVNAVFTVTLSTASRQTVTVIAATADGTAIAPGDYTAIPSQTVTFAPGVTTQTVTVTVISDTLDEVDQTFFVNLSAASDAVISDAQGVGTIIDDDTVMFRLFNMLQNLHVFTTSRGEFEALVGMGVCDETSGQPAFTVCTVQLPGTSAIHRLYNPNGGQHYLTTSDGDRDFLASRGWNIEPDQGFTFPSAAAGTTEIFHLYSNKNGDHLYTANNSERLSALAIAGSPQPWVQHARLGFAFPTSATTYTPPQQAGARNTSATIDPPVFPGSVATSVAEPARPALAIHASVMAVASSSNGDSTPELSTEPIQKSRAERPANPTRATSLDLFWSQDDDDLAAVLDWSI